MTKTLTYIANYEDYNNTISINKKLEFFKETRYSYGRTALMLSGIIKQ